MRSANLVQCWVLVDIVILWLTWMWWQHNHECLSTILLHHITCLWWANIQRDYIKWSLIVFLLLFFIGLFWLWVLQCCLTSSGCLNLKLIFFIPLRSHRAGHKDSGITAVLSLDSFALLFLAWPMSGQMTVTALFEILYWSLQEKFDFSLVNTP